MNLSNRLCNPSPFDVEWPYDKGVKLKIPADGYIDLPVEIMDDFRPDKPGYEAVKLQMDQYGIFLKDPTIPYEKQAVEALEACVRSRKAQYDDAHNNLSRRAAQQGNYDKKSFEETLRQLGFAALKEKTGVIDKRLDKFKRRAVKMEATPTKYDPKRTLLFLDPPKEFDSEVAMEIFLEENPKIKEQHDSWLAAQGD